MVTRLAAYLLRGIVRPDTDEIHLGVYAGWDYTWNYMHEVVYPPVADAIALGSLGFVNTAAGQYFLTAVAQSWTMANFASPLGSYYAVTWRASDGLVLTAYAIANPVAREVTPENRIRLMEGTSEGRPAIFGPLLDVKALGFPSGNTKRGELLFIGGFVQWLDLQWAVLLLDDTWNTDPVTADAVNRNVNTVADIPFSAWVMPPVALTGKVVSERGGAFANNVQFPPPAAGRAIRHAAIYVNTGNIATSEVARIITLDLAGAPLISNGVDPVWLDFRGRPVLYFGVGQPPDRLPPVSGPQPIVVNG